MEAYLLITLSPVMAHFWEISDAAQKIEGVKRADPVLGNFDVIAHAEFSNLNELRWIIDNVLSIEGVQHIQTCLIMQPELKE